MVLRTDMCLNKILEDVTKYFNHDTQWKKQRLVSYDRFQTFLEYNFPKWIIHNYTDFNYDYCNTYYINKPFSKQCPTQPEIQLYISYVSDVYDIVVGIRKLQNFRFSPISETVFTHNFGPYTKIISDYIELQGFIKMKEEWNGYFVPNIKTQLCKKPTLERCLFHDRE